MAAHRYWRVRFNAQSGVATPSAAEVQFRSVAGGAHEAGTVTVSSSFNATTNPVSNLFDGNAATWWACNSGANSWIAIDYGAGGDKAIIELFWQARADSGSQSPGKLFVDWSDDGATWVPFADFTGLTWTNGQSRTFDLTAVGDARFYQLNAEVTHDGAPNAPLNIFHLSIEVIRSINPPAAYRSFMNFVP